MFGSQVVVVVMAVVLQLLLGVGVDVVEVGMRTVEVVDGDRHEAGVDSGVDRNLQPCR